MNNDDDARMHEIDDEICSSRCTRETCDNCIIANTTLREYDAHDILLCVAFVYAIDDDARARVAHDIMLCALYAHDERDARALTLRVASCAYMLHACDATQRVMIDACESYAEMH